MTDVLNARARLFPSLLLSALLLALSACSRGPDDSATRPPAGPADPDIRHVILISIDTLRADHLACYGHPTVKSPHFDRLAAEGILFESTIAAAPTTLASHTSLLTGTYPHTHGTPRNSFVVNARNVTLAESLQQAGFATAAFVGSFALHSRFGLSQGFDHYDQQFDLLEGPDHVYDQSQRLADKVTDAVLDWLDRNQPERMFLFIHYFDVHWPYTPPPPYDRMYRDDTLPITGSLRDIGLAKEMLARRRPEGRDLARALDALYCGEVTYTDLHVGRLLDELRTRGILDKSLLILTSDHGETMDEHWDLFNHGLHVYDTTVRIPLIIRQPGGKGAGTRVERLISNIDLMPTILDRLSLPHPARIEGQSVAPLLAGQTMPPREPVFAEATQPWDDRIESDPLWRNARKSRAVRTTRWKYIVRPWNPLIEMFDVQADPGEQKNLAHGDDAEAQKQLPALRDRLDAWSRSARPLPSEIDTQQDTLEKLKSLGYVRENADEIDAPPADAPRAGDPPQP